MVWKGESRRHSLARKGIKTVIDDSRRLPVNRFVARGNKYPELRTPDDDPRSVDEVIIEYLHQFGAYPIHIEEYNSSFPKGTIYIFESESEDIPDTIIIDGEEWVVTRLRGITSDGAFKYPPRNWYFDEETITLFLDDNGSWEWEQYDWDDPNNEIWEGLPLQHPNRWWNAMRKIGGGDVMGIDPTEVEDVLVVSNGRDDGPGYMGEVEEVIPMSRLEKIDGDNGRDWHSVTYKDKKTGKEYVKYVSYWQGEPDYHAYRKEVAEKKYGD